MTSFRAIKKIALSMEEMKEDNQNNITVVPPLLRRDIISISPESGDYLHGYMMNNGLISSIEDFHKSHPEIVLHFFWNNLEANEETHLDNTLSYHLIDDVKFLNLLANCKAYAAAAGFESICEAMYLGKPILMVSEHIAHDCNAHEAIRMGAGIAASSFDLDKLLQFSVSYQINKKFLFWARSSERCILQEIEEVINHHSYSSMSNYSKCMSV